MMSKELLKKVIPFTDNDLETNRRQLVSAAQLQRLKNEVNNLSEFGCVGLLVSMVLFFVVGIIFSKMEYKKPLVQNLESLPPLLLGSMVLGVIVFFFSGFLVLWSRLRRKAYDGRLEVKIVEGKVERFTPGVDEYSFTVKVGNVDFYVDEKTHDAFTGDYYRVYFLDSSDLLSAEEIKQVT